MEDSQQTLTKSGPVTDETDPATLFDDGDLAGGRYRIIRFIARGGAAEVYEAEDEDLRQRVALKALARDPSKTRKIERFKREINLARQVTHPNVCRIFEFGHHGSHVLYLTMELLDGETLLERIQADGPMSTGEALPLARQMASGLDAAHRAGVIHRDFKCGNVMLVPSAEEAGGFRAVITDFGLARGMASDDPGPRVTAHDTLVGTPAYMAPEQVEGSEITPAADVYAFGVVLYEMMTGQYPFQGESSLATAILRLKDPPTPPSVHVPGLDQRWEEVILHCLERKPGNRFAHVRDVVRTLDGVHGLEVRRADDSVEERVHRRSVKPFVALAAVLALSAGVGWWSVSNRPPPPPELDGTTAPAARRSIALLGFTNLSGQASAQWLSTAFAEMLATEVAAGEDLRVIPGENVARTRIELGLDDVDRLDTDSLERIGDILGSDLLVVGSYLVAGAGASANVRLDVRIHTTADGETLARISERGSQEEVLDLVDRTGQALRAELGLAGLSMAEAEELRASQPATSESARLYAQGLQELRLYNAKEALELLTAAAESDADNPLIHSALSAAWEALGYAPRAQEEARRAFDLAGHLGQRERLWVEARYHEFAGDPRRAVENYRLLWDKYPDNVEYGLRLAAAQTRISEGEAALATVARLRARSPAMRTDPRIDLAEADAARSLARYEQQQDRSSEAARKAVALGARLLAARAREMEGGSFRELGRPEEAMAAFEEAREIYDGANNRGAVARVLISQAQIHRYQARFEDARGLVEEALGVARDIGDQGSVRLALSTLAIMLRQQGKLSEALEMHQLEVRTVREIGELENLRFSLTNRGVARREMGDLAGALTDFEEALDLSRQSGNQRSLAINHNLLGEVLLRQGDLAEARLHFEEALELNRETRVPRGRAYYLMSLGDADLAAGLVAEAFEKHKEAFEIRQSLNEKTNMAVSRLALAKVAIEDGRPEEAVTLALDAAREFRAEEKSDDEGWAMALVAKARLAAGRPEEAEDAARQAEKLLEGSENRGIRLLVLLRAAEVDAAARRFEVAHTKLDEVRIAASELGFLDLALEAGWHLGQLESRSDPAAGAARIKAVVQEASRCGFQLLVNKIGDAP